MEDLTTNISSSGYKVIRIGKSNPQYRIATIEVKHTGLSRERHDNFYNSLTTSLRRKLRRLYEYTFLETTRPYNS